MSNVKRCTAPFSILRAALFTIHYSVSPITIAKQISRSSSKPVEYLSKKAMFEARNNRNIPALREQDIEETFIRGARRARYPPLGMHSATRYE
jgi:hypothetical protein